MICCSGHFLFLFPLVRASVLGSLEVLFFPVERLVFASLKETGSQPCCSFQNPPTSSPPKTKNEYALKWFLESHFLSQCLRLPHLRALPYGSVFLGSCDADSHLTKVTPLRMLEAGVRSEIWFKRSWMTHSLTWCLQPMEGACNLLSGLVMVWSQLKAREILFQMP